MIYYGEHALYLAADSSDLLSDHLLIFAELVVAAAVAAVAVAAVAQLLHLLQLLQLLQLLRLVARLVARLVFVAQLVA